MENKLLLQFVSEILDNGLTGLQINISLDRTFVRSLLILVGHNLNLVGHIYVTRYI